MRAFLGAFLAYVTVTDLAAAAGTEHLEEVSLDVSEVDRMDEFGDDDVSAGDDDESVEMQLMEASFVAGDADGNGKLNREEAVALAKSQNPTGGDDPEFVKDVLRDFEEYDSDRDNSLTLAEFVEMLDSFGRDAEGDDDQDNQNHDHDYGNAHSALDHHDDDRVDEIHGSSNMSTP
eukprot:TRINITY_DN50368_c0_g1_i1.p1 TRINITY_DN50368_c0_g1~~TRINITY_DN50368_c0_g1_i1.p1  ORF type:complete len:206 (-),score=48.66 TRINITY_DN50368_c0_g1_i1:148-675(-)